MREIRVFQPGNYKCGDVIELSDEAAHHVGVVLRMKVSQKLILFPGNNNEFVAEITSLLKKKVEVKIVVNRFVDRESCRKIHLAQGISKGERMEIVVQKATELGVSSITPLMTARCAVKLDPERKEKKRLQWQAIAVAACEQSGRNQLPIIHPIISLSDYLSKKDNSLNLALSPTGTMRWRDMTILEQEIRLLVGPEGGLDEEELHGLNANNFLFLQLGPRILRTETASISAISVLQALFGDL